MASIIGPWLVSNMKAIKRGDWGGGEWEVTTIGVCGGGDGVTATGVCDGRGLKGIPMHGSGSIRPA